MYPDFKNMLNRKIASVELNRERDVITFTFQDGFERTFSTEGDCCSHSWIEHLEMPNNIAGATLLAVEASDTITQDHAEHDDSGEIKVYNTSFKTDRGEIILEYRNSSNGYYGGWLTNVR